jgi:hypothetical protein
MRHAIICLIATATVFLATPVFAAPDNGDAGAAVSGASEDGTEAPRFAFSIEKFYNDQFESPVGVFFDRESEEVYVLDGGRGEVFVFTSDGTPVFRFPAVNPAGIAVAGGRIYLSLEGTDYVQVLNYRAEPLFRFRPPEGTPFQPGRIRADRDRLYVLNKAATNCLLFDLKGNYIGVFGAGGGGGEGGGNPAFKSLSDVAIGEDRVYLITPYESRAIHVYGKDGRHIASFEAIYDFGGTLGLPMAARVDMEGRLWLLDSLKGIIIYGPDHKEVTRYGERGASYWQLFFPVDLDFGMGNMIYITEKSLKRISVFKAG